MVTIANSVVYNSQQVSANGQNIPRGRMSQYFLHAIQGIELGFSNSGLSVHVEHTAVGWGMS